MAEIKDGVLCKVFPSDLTINGHYKTPAEVTSIALNAFDECKDELHSLFISASVKKIDKLACFECASLKSLVISEGVEEIGKFAFSDCTGLESLVLPKGLKTIGDSAFSRCSNIIEVTLTDEIKSFNLDAFFECKQKYKLKLIYTDTGKKPLSGNVKIPLNRIPELYTELLPLRCNIDGFFSKSAINTSENTSQSAAPSQP